MLNMNRTLSWDYHKSAAGRRTRHFVRSFEFGFALHDWKVRKPSVSSTLRAIIYATQALESVLPEVVQTAVSWSTVLPL